MAKAALAFALVHEVKVRVEMDDPDGPIHGVMEAANTGEQQRVVPAENDRDTRAKDRG